MFEFTLDTFTKDTDFPFFIQYGSHEDNLFLHGHKDFSELVIVLSGHATHVVNRESFFVQAGDVFVLNQKAYHCYTDCEDFKICNIMFSLSALLALNYDITSSVGFHSLFILEPNYVNSTHFNILLKLSASRFLVVKDLISNMVTEYTAQSEGRKTLLTAYFLQLITLLSRTYEAQNENDNSEITKLATAVSFLEKTIQKRYPSKCLPR